MRCACRANAALASEISDKPAELGRRGHSRSIAANQTGYPSPERFFPVRPSANFRCRGCAGAPSCRTIRALPSARRGSFESGVWNDRSTTPQPISLRASDNGATISSGPPQKLIGSARLTLAGRRRRRCAGQLPTARRRPGPSAGIPPRVDTAPTPAPPSPGSPQSGCWRDR